MTDFFESQGESIDPDNFNLDVHQPSIQPPQIQTQAYIKQTIDVRIQQLKHQVDQFRQQLIVQTTLNPKKKNDLVLIETLLKDLQTLEKSESETVNEAFLSRYLKQLELLASPEQKDKQQLKLIFSTSTKQQQDNHQSLEARVMLVESILGGQKERKQAQVDHYNNPMGQNVMAQMHSISTSVKTLKESCIDYKEPIQELFKQVAQLQQAPDSAHQLNIIFDRLKIIQGISDVLPLLANRLMQLRDVHQKSIGIKQQFETMVTRHQNVTALITKNSARVESLRNRIFSEYNSLVVELDALDSKYAKKI